MVESRISTFFQNDQKPPRAENINSFCLDYNSHSVDILAKKLVKKMKNFAPEFAINTCFRSIKISQIYSFSFKPKTDMFQTANVVYNFQCLCASSYIGQTKKKLIIRVGQHQQASRKGAICSHIKFCPTYKNKFKYFREAQKNKLSMTEFKLKFEYFKSHFKIAQKNFRSKWHRLEAEAFFIRMNRPNLNDQKEQDFLKLF